MQTRIAVALLAPLLLAGLMLVGRIPSVEQMTLRLQGRWYWQDPRIDHPDPKQQHVFMEFRRDGSWGSGLWSPDGLPTVCGWTTDGTDRDSGKWRVVSVENERVTIELSGDARPPSNIQLLLDGDDEWVWTTRNREMRYHRMP